MAWAVFSNFKCRWPLHIGNPVAKPIMKLRHCQCRATRSLFFTAWNEIRSCAYHRTALVSACWISIGFLNLSSGNLIGNVFERLLNSTTTRPVADNADATDELFQSNSSLKTSMFAIKPALKSSKFIGAATTSEVAGAVDWHCKSPRITMVFLSMLISRASPENINRNGWYWWIGPSPT